MAKDGTIGCGDAGGGLPDVALKVQLAKLSWCLCEFEWMPEGNGRNNDRPPWSDGLAIPAAH